jgi:guanine deaminase
MSTSPSTSPLISVTSSHDTSPSSSPDISPESLASVVHSSNLNNLQHGLDRIYVSTFIHSPLLGKLEILERHMCGIDADGYIAFLEPHDEVTLNSYIQQFELNAQQVIRTEEHEFFVPGFVDTHIHAPQYAFLGSKTDKPLLEWLDCYTFPTEAKLADTKLAKEVYSNLLDTLISCGTTTSLMYATIHLESTKVLAQLAAEKGCRALVGKVCMDRNSKGYYIESTKSAVQQTKEFIDFVHSLKNPRIHPVITPRFIPTCTDELLFQLADLYKQYSNPEVNNSAPSCELRDYVPRVYIQTHADEGDDETAWVREIHEKTAGKLQGKLNDVNLLDHFGLLTDHCVLAHGVLIETEEQKKLFQRGTSIAHCPLSNFYLADHPLPTRQLLQRGNKLGLGSDLAGGPSACMLTAMRNSILNSKVTDWQIKLENKQNGAKNITVMEEKQCTPCCSAENEENEWKKKPVINWIEAFYIATQGGANSLNLGAVIGSFAVNKAFDCLRIECSEKHPACRMYSHDQWQDKVEKFLLLGDDRMISQTYVQGKQIKTSSHHHPIPL